MPLLGRAAMLLSFDVVEEAIPEHDEWHTHEHLPERLSIPAARYRADYTLVADELCAQGGRAQTSGIQQE